MARALTGLSRQDLYETAGIATSTIDTWESGRVELSQKGAERVCNSLYNLGICCTAEWLLTGQGMPPHFMSDIEKLMHSGREAVGTENSQAAVINQNAIPQFLDANLKKELSFFLDLHKNALFCIVQTNDFKKKYAVGDCVAGLIQNAQNLIGRTVILQKPDSTTLIGNLRATNENVAEIYFDNKSDLLSVEFLHIANIIWHRSGTSF